MSTKVASCVTLIFHPKSLGDSHHPTKDYDSEKSEPDNGGHSQSSTTQLNLRLEEERLKTFKNWQNKAVTPEELAKAGFYYLNKGDVVKCAFCNTEGCEWVSGDNPMSDHSKWSPHCPLVREKSPQSESDPSDQDVCGSRNEIFPNSVPENETFKLLRNIKGIEKIRPCSHSKYSTYESRLESFAEWPKSLKQKPVKLAEAGFFYKEVGDQTLCYHCGGGLKDWEDNDDPWEQHALWFPKCNFLVLTKGQDFVDLVRNKFKAEDLSVPSTSNSKENQENTEETEKEEETSKSEVKLADAEKNQQEDSQTLCKICYKNELGVIFLPCGHVVACVECSLSLNNICPVCRKKFEATIRAFLS